MDENKDSELEHEIVSKIKGDLEYVSENEIESTSWIFYSEVQSDDAIGDKVRASFMVRELKGNFVAIYNMSDFDFVTAYESLEEFKSNVLAALNLV